MGGRDRLAARWAEASIDWAAAPRAHGTPRTTAVDRRSDEWATRTSADVSVPRVVGFSLITRATERVKVYLPGSAPPAVGVEACAVGVRLARPRQDIRRC